MPQEIYQAETIAAIATAIVPEQGSVGIVRLSGLDAIAIAKALFHAPGHQLWESHRILYGHVHSDQTIVDEALLLLMKSPRSYTREDVVEFHCHGGIMAVQQVLQLCLEQGARLAQPGEFTLRAFLNGRLDLTQAEGVADLVGAQSPQAAQTALMGIRGQLAGVIRQLRSQCLDVLAEVEARVDFADDLPPIDEDGVRSRLQSIHHKITQVLATAHRGELLRAGLKVAIIGQPNVGKSSLLNAWSKSDRAIVTNLPGTTRDVVESQLIVGGIPIQVLDTAGIRTAANEVEKIGIERSLTAAQSADLVLLTIDATIGWTEADQTLYEQIKSNPHIIVINKVDLFSHPPSPIDAASCFPSASECVSPTVYTAAAINHGIQELESAILAAVNAGNLTAANTDIAINQRQAAALTRAEIALTQVEQTIANGLPLDFWTIDLRAAIHALGEVTGEEITESMLDEIFSRFCIGK
ncbi:tRNA uridine-5-carboxymethylaminomethyl(34) synthesis GTPase MnmE [cf. Phormidesmis sp. LEGE 11477]|uniref:tRNA uridine-5-carboxymethylaminomethyl(34) synthesis GTPase MnmE n=1 Tax=cf. Phormidesmis sp. LEGE 11477 TaxID=1828680 RepID=UPI0018815ED6|nr:tRNA uridine-5-carboxymethylaminomethyl(34) synthesis GTPase MnmE [cf. Phormidesmis sp. LEGE 11477]MBE9060776.1 tRNA uridine-5-carboxymethylaminomethyl(34) synthesis GTPase MnmE [cf. Phormidesmis sp. LEGE 11477]